MFQNRGIQVAFAALVVASASTIGCSGEVAESDARTESAPALPQFSAAGVELHTSTTDHAEGRFDRDGATIGFDLSFDRAEAIHHVLITRASGEHLYESTVKDGVDTSSYLDGRVKTTGPVGQEPEKDGDLSAFDALSAMPEGKIMPQLKTALGAAGVSDDLLSAATSSTHAGITPQVYGAGGTTSYPDNIWRLLGSRQTISFYSWGFWATTAIVYENADPSTYAVLNVRAGSAPLEQLSGYGEQRVYRQWWGAYVTVTNAKYVVCSLSGACGDAPVWVLVK